MTDTRPDSWMTAEQLAEEWGQSVRWVKDHFASGEIPTIKVGGRRFFSPECRAQLVAAQLTDATPESAWGRPQRGKP